MIIRCAECGSELNCTREEPNILYVDLCEECESEQDRVGDYECSTYRGYSRLVDSLRSDTLVCETEVNDLKEEIIEIERLYEKRIQKLESDIRYYEKCIYRS